MLMSLKQRKIKFESRIKLNHNIYTIAVKCLNRYFCLFFIAGISLTSLVKNGQRCINQLVNITIFPFFFQNFELFSLKTLRAKRKSCWKMAPIITSASVFNHLELF